MNNGSQIPFHISVRVVGDDSWKDPDELTGREAIRFLTDRFREYLLEHPEATDLEVGPKPGYCGPVATCSISGYLEVKEAKDED